MSVTVTLAVPSRQQAVVAALRVIDVVTAAPAVVLE